MPAFISYNSKDRKFAEDLGKKLVAEGHHIWIDQWELNVGDSLIDKIQSAIGEASAVIAVLSQNSVKSNWCKKEINSTLIRELERSGSLLLPCVIDDCEIPLFLREKLYADFRAEPKRAFGQLSDALLRYSNKTQSRFQVADHHVDYGFTDGTYDSGRLRFAEWTFIEHSPDMAHSILTSVRALFDHEASSRWTAREQKGLQYIFLAATLEFALPKIKEAKFLLTDAMPKLQRIVARDISGFEFEVIVETSRLGQDNGKSTLVHVANYVEQAHAYLLAEQRAELAAKSRADRT